MIDRRKVRHNFYFHDTATTEIYTYEHTLSLHDALPGWELEKSANPPQVIATAKQSMAVHVRALLDFHKAGIPTFDYGNNIRQVALDEGVAEAFDFPGFVPAYIRPLFCRGIGPFRWAALSGDPEDIYRTDAKRSEEHTSELQSLMRTSYAFFCLKKKNIRKD